MKFTSILATALITASAIAMTPLAQAHATHGQPQYGGIYGEAGTFQLELVAKSKHVTFYATVHGEPISTAGANGKLIILNSEGQTEVDLKPAGENRLVAELKEAPAKGSKLVAAVTLAGKAPANIRYVIE